jgi:transaldolase
MILAAAHDLDLDLDGSFVVGDRWRDIGAGRAAGCRTILVGDAVEPEHLEPDERFRSLVGAVGSIAARHGGRLQATPTLSDLRIRIFADGADEATIARLAADPLVSGFTTNPTLMRSAGVTDYEAFARRILPLVGDRPISLEVFADDEREIEAQAREISSWGGSVYVKIPITDTRGRPLLGVIEQLSGDGIAINVTAVMTLRQVRDAAAALARSPRAYISIFAGRVADTGRDPVPIVAAAVQALRPYPAIELIWASPRELLNVFHADAAGCHIITVTQELLAKAALVGKDLDEYSLDTVKMFHRDAATAGYKIRPRQASGRATR